MVARPAPGWLPQVGDWAVVEWSRYDGRDRRTFRRAERVVRVGARLTTQAYGSSTSTWRWDGAQWVPFPAEHEVRYLRAPVEADAGIIAEAEVEEARRLEAARAAAAERAQLVTALLPRAQQLLDGMALVELRTHARRLRVAP